MTLDSNLVYQVYTYTSFLEDNDGYIWIIKYLKHQRNLPITPKNNAHKAILKSFEEHIDKFPDVFDHLPISDSEIIKDYLTRGIRGLTPSTPLSPTSKGIGKSKGNK